MAFHRTLLLSATALAASVATASAADYSATGNLFQGDVLRPSITPKLGGFVFGVVGGYTFGEVEPSAWFLPSGKADDDLTGPDGGLLVGYELTNGPFFTGFELLAIAGGPGNEYDYEDGGSLDFSVDGHVDARFRSGWMFTDRIAGYGIIGATVARISVEASDGFDDYGGEDWVLGWVGGGGLEFLINQNLSIAAEYNFTGLEQESYDEEDNVTIDSSFHAVRGALRARF